MNQTPSDESSVLFAVADLSRGQVTERIGDHTPSDSLEGLAAAAPGLCNETQSALSLLTGKPSAARSDGYDDVILISPKRIYAVHRESVSSDRALLAVCPRERSVGWVLNQLRGEAERVFAQSDA